MYRVPRIAPCSPAAGYCRGGRQVRRCAFLLASSASHQPPMRSGEHDRSHGISKLAGTGALHGRIAPVLIAAVIAAAPARAADPIKIGFSMALTGALASGGKVMLITLKMWEEDVNARGGLLGRPVQLVYYDDQSNGSLVPGIYTKLLDVDKVDLVVSSYATNVAAPAMPVVMQKNKMFL